MTRTEQRRTANAMLRWIPVAALLPATVGIVIAIGWPRLAELGFTLVAGAFALAVWLPLVGPLKPWGKRVPDEFDRMIQTRAWLAGFGASSFAAMIGIFLLIAMGLAGDWDRLTLLLALRSLLCYLLVLQSAVPSLIIAGALIPEDD